MVHSSGKFRKVKTKEKKNDKNTADRLFEIGESVYLKKEARNFRGKHTSEYHHFSEKYQ
jgi:hypothetical protein